MCRNAPPTPLDDLMRLLSVDVGFWACMHRESQK